MNQKKQNASAQIRPTPSAPRNQEHTVNFPNVLECTYVSRLGEGSYGKVYLVEDRRSSARRALKMYDFARVTPDYRQKFAPREVDILLKISHPNIIATHRMCRSGQFLYILMDYAAFKDLEFYIRNVCPGIIQENQARIWTRQIANALEYLHEIGMVHRDLKCENILVTKRLNAKLADFGFTRIMVSPRELSSTYCGTQNYAPPEILKNTPYNGKLADVWSLGVVLYCILNKQFPFGNTETRRREVLRRQEAREYTFSRQFDISVEAKQMISRMLEPNPRHRINAKDVQTHPWILHEPSCQSATQDENEALAMGRLRSREFAVRLPVVDQLMSADVNVNITQGYAGRIFQDTGEAVEEDSISVRVCENSTTT